MNRRTLLAVSVFVGIGTTTLTAEELPDRGARIHGLKSTAKPFGVRVTTNNPTGIFFPGDKPVFEVHLNRTPPNGVWLYVFYEQADGELLCVFPNGWNRNNRVWKAGTLSIPSRTAPAFEIVLTDEPLGVERVKVLAFDRELPEHVARQLVAKGTLPPIQPRTRGAVVQATRQYDRSNFLWESAEVAFCVKAKPRVHIPRADANRAPRPAPKPILLRETKHFGAFWGCDFLGKAKKWQLPSAPREAASTAHSLARTGNIETTNVYKGELATKEAFVREIDSMVKRTEAGDTVVLGVWSHATRVRDKDGDEAPDKTDEAIYFNDGSILTDDELGVQLRKLQGRRIVLILDICFAGGFSKHERGGAGRFDFLDKPHPNARDTAQRDVVILGSCRATQRAINGELGEMTPFTSAFLFELETASAARIRLTLEQLHRRIVKRMESRNPRITATQLPVLTGDLDLAKKLVVVGNP